MAKAAAAKKKPATSARQNTNKPKLYLVKAKPNTAQTYKKPKVASGGWKNPFTGGRIAGLDVMDVVGATGGVLANSAVELIMQPGWARVGVEWGITFALLKFAPKSIAGGASIGAGALALRSTGDLLTGNAISNFFNNTVQRLIPAPPAQPAGMGRVLQYR